jgi:predicted O-linked N-acetylglucosamine transferase (SPINDLY family)
MQVSLSEEPQQFDVIQHWVHIRQKQCAWPAARPFAEVTANRMLVGTSPLAMLSTADDPALQLMAAQRFVHQRVPKPPAVPLHREARAKRLAGLVKPDGRLKIAYVSGDLHLHAVGMLTAEVFALHDRSRVEVHAFCWGRDDGSEIRRRIVQNLDHHHRIGGLDDQAAAQLIAQQGIDVVIDLQGLTSGARPGILIQQPAPVQVSWLGFPGTCALPGVDWIVADDFVMPPELEPFHTERPIRLPHCYQVSDRQRVVGPTPRRADHGLPEDAFVYCSFNNNHKMNETMFGAWMRVMSQVPGSVLWLLADNRWAEANLRREAAARGVDPARLVFAPRVSPADYLARFQLADLVLDTFPYNAGTTASDVLWAGVPIMTLSGRSYISRMCGSLLHAVGLPDLVTYTLADYERLAVQIGRTPARAASYRRYLAEEGRRSALFDVPGIVRSLEDALNGIARPG